MNSAFRDARAAQRRAADRRGSVLIIVLWITFGLVSLALYFADSMNYELRASDNQVSNQVADEAIEGAARYVMHILALQVANGSNGVMPNANGYLTQAVPVGDAQFWLIGRDTTNSINQNQMVFGLVDEASRFNLNTATSNSMSWLPRMTPDFLQAILDWRDTNANGPTVTYYLMQQPAYACKCERFETVDELRLLYGADMDILVGEDPNRNGLLDPNENDENQNRESDPGVLEYFTVFSREPNTNRVNISSVTRAQFQTALTNLDSSRIQPILSSLRLTGSTRRQFPSPLALYAESASGQSGLTLSEFALVATNLTTTNGTYFEGRVNVNTASAKVLTALLDGDSAAAQQLVSYRQGNPNNLTSVAWVIEALGQNYTNAIQTLASADCITVQSYQFTADIAAVGPRGRGYRRVRFVIDTADGTPKIVFRQDLTHLGWALGAQVRQNLLLAKATR